MNGDDENSKFSRSINKFIKRQWSKVISFSSSLKSKQNLDYLLEEEYETLLREIDYLTTENSCFLSFKNDNFFNGKSSEDFTKILRQCSEEVLKTYISQHGKEAGEDVSKDRSSLVNYVTKIIISKPKCNSKICTCGPPKSTKEVFTTDDTVQKDTKKEAQIIQSTDTLVGNVNPKETKKEAPTSQYANTLAGVAGNVNSREIKKEAQTSQYANTLAENANPKETKKEAQTNQSTNTLVGNLNSKETKKEAQTNQSTNTLVGNLNSKETKKEAQTSQSTNTLVGNVNSTQTTDDETEKNVHRQASLVNTEVQTDDCCPNLSCCLNISLKSAYANCVADTVEALTSTTKLCVPENFETILNNNKANKFSTCAATKECECEAYDVKEALKRGLVLPGSDICIQTKKRKSKVEEKKTSSKKGKKNDSTTSDGYETSTETSSDNSAKKTKKKTNKENGKRKSILSEKFDSSSDTLLEKPKNKKQKKETTGCFGARKRQKKCDEQCQGIGGRQRSMQTLPIGTQDKSEEAYLFEESDRKAIQTSTNSEKGIQLSARQSKENFRRSTKQDKGISYKEDKETFEDQEYMYINKNPKADKATEGSINKGAKCGKCGRQKRDCDNRCRNTIIIPYAAGSNGAILPGDAESLRMLIKMQNKDTSRQFDNIMAQLNHQKSEISRLNDMYQKMVEGFSDSQKTGSSSRSNTKKASDVSHVTYDAKKRPDMAKPSCGCSFFNECKVDNKNNIQTGKGAHDSYNECFCKKNSNNSQKRPVKAFGPPNTAVAINRCDTCAVEISGANTRNRNSSRDLVEGDKQRKEQLNQCKRAGHNIILRLDTIGSEGQGDFGLYKTDSVSTLYKNDKNNQKKEATVSRRDGHENLHGIIRNLTQEEDLIELHQLPRVEYRTNTLNFGTETDSSEPEKKPRSTNSSKALVWLKKSWLIAKHKQRNKDKKGRDRAKGINHVFSVCQNTAKRATGIWKSLKKVKKA